MRTVSYPSDLTGFQWSLIKPHLPVYPGGRPRKTDLRDVVDAIFYILRTGCQWRYLPKDFPPKSTVWRYFNQWRHNGTLETIHDLLRRKVRAAEKPYSPRTSASVDSQSVDTTSGGEQRGRDNAKNVDGRKRHIVVDSMGLLMAVRKYSVNPSPALAFSRSDGYSRPLWTTDQPPCSVSRPCGSQSRNWHPSPLVRHRIPRHRNPFVPPRLSPSAPVRFARG